MLRSGVGASLIALVLPLVVLGAAWTGLAADPGTTGKAAAMDRELTQAGPPDVVVLGSSLARTDVDLDVLARELRVPRRRVVLLTLPNATAPHLYAVLENRVFGQGYRPKLVLIVGALTTMITPDVLKDVNGERLVNLLSDHEPVIARKVFHSEDPGQFYWLSLRARAGELRDGLLDAWRDLALAALFQRNGRQGGANLAERANAQVFADEKMEYALHDAHPTGLYVGEVEQIELAGLDVARDSLLPDIAALAEQFEARLAFVRTPFPPSYADNDRVAPELERAAAETIAAGHATYVDLAGLNLDDTYFRDMRHMSTEGAALFTRALARRVVGLIGGRVEGGGGVHVTRSTRTPVTLTPPVFRRSGPCSWVAGAPSLAALDDAALAQLGVAGGSPVRVAIGGAPVPWRSGAGQDGDCVAGFSIAGGHVHVATAGDGAIVASLDAQVGSAGREGYWWVYPGTTLELAFDQPWTRPPDAFVVQLLAEVLGGDTDGVGFAVFGQDVPLAHEGTRVWSSHVVAPAPVDRPWSVTVTSANRFVLVRNLAIGAAPFTTHLIGQPETLYGASTRIVGGRPEDTQVDAVFAGPPLALVTPDLRPAPRGTAQWFLPQFVGAHDVEEQRQPRGDACSPFRVLEDGVVMPYPHAPCLEIPNLRNGRSCHARDVLRFSASDGSDPTTNGRAYTLGLEPTRRCERKAQLDNTTPLRESLWLYPGDTATLALAPDQLQKFLQGGDQLELAADPFFAREGAQLHVALWVGGQVVHEEDVVTAGGGQREFRQRLLSPRLAPQTTDVELVLSNPDPSAYWLVVKAALSESSPFAPTLEAREAARDDAWDPRSEAPRYAAGDADFVERGPRLFDDPLPVDGMKEPTSITRLGQPLALPVSDRLVSTHAGVVDARLVDLWPVSNSALAARQLGWVSPVRVWRGDSELLPALSRRAFLDPACAERCFLHRGEQISVRSADTTTPLRLGLVDALPWTAPHGERVVWAYPGTTLRLTWEQAWTQPQAYLEVRLTELRGGGASSSSSSSSSVRVGDLSANFQPGEAWSAARVYLGAPRGGPLVLDVLLPELAPFSLLRGVVLVDGERRWALLPDPAERAVPVEN